jgi:hypothetical protein
LLLQGLPVALDPGETNFGCLAPNSGEGGMNVGFLGRLLGRSQEQGVLWLHARCGRCGAKVRVRINLINDLSLDDEGGFILRKEMLDDQCFQLMRAELHFDGKRRELLRHIEGGEFITRDEYETSDAA